MNKLYDCHLTGMGADMTVEDAIKDILTYPDLTFYKVQVLKVRATERPDGTWDLTFYGRFLECVLF